MIMKKLLLMWMVAMLAAVNLYAEEEGGMGKWQKSFQPVTNADDMGTVRVAQAPDGSVYVSSKWNAALQFAKKNVAKPEIESSSIILKYDADGEEQWAVTLEGNVLVKTMAVDADGTLYAAGEVVEVATFTGADGASKTATGDSFNISTFVVKISKDGKVEAVQVFTPETDETIGSAMGEVWGDYTNLYPGWDPISMTPNNIQVVGDNVYVSAYYAGDVPSLGWEGCYFFNEDFGMYADTQAAGVFMLNKSDLSGATSVANVKATEEVCDHLYGVDAINFMVTPSMVGVCFIGNGKLTLTTSKGTKDFTDWEYDGDDIAHPMVFALITNDLKTLVFPADANNYYASPGDYDFLRPVLENGKVYLAGSFYGNFALDRDVTNNIPTTFLGALDLLKMEADWVITSPAEAGAVKPKAMVVIGDEIKLATDKGLVSIETATGKFLEMMDMLVADGDAYNNEYSAIAMVNDNTVTIVSMNMDGGDNPGGDDDGDSFGHWTKTIEPVVPVTDEGSSVDKNLKGLHTAVALDGSVYASTTFDQPFSFAGKSLPDTEGMLSTAILKYNNQGKEQWAVALEGAALVTAMTAEFDGTLYAAGTFMDKVTIVSADGSTQVVENNDDKYTAYVIKVSKDGKVEAVKTLTSEVNEYIASQVGDPWDMGVESPLYQAWEPIEITPTAIHEYGGRVYVSALYTGDVAELGWKGSYADQWGMMYTDNLSQGIFSLAKSDLSSPTSVANVQMTDVVAAGDYSPEGIDFVIDEGTIYLGFFVMAGDLTLTTASATENISVDYGKQQYVLATITNNNTSVKRFDGFRGDKKGGAPKSILVAEGDKLFIGGTFYGELPFDNSKTSGAFIPATNGEDNRYTYWNTAFLTSLNKADGSVNWTLVPPVEQETNGLALAFEGGNLMASMSIGTMLIDANSGNVMTDKSKTQTLEDLVGIKTAVNGYIYRKASKEKGVKVYVCGRYKADEAQDVLTDVKEIDAPADAAADVPAFNLMGQPIDASYKGIAVTKSGKLVLVK